MSTMTPEEKKIRIRELKTKIGASQAVINAAEQEVQNMKVQAAPDIAELIKLTGRPAPHGIPVPQADGSTLKLIAAFRKHGKTFAVSAAPQSDLDD